MPRPQAARRPRPSSTTSAWGSSAAAGERSSAPTTRSQVRPSQPPDATPVPRRALPNAIPASHSSRLSRCSPSRPPSAHTTLTGRDPSPSTPTAAPKPSTSASISATARTTRARPCQRSSASRMPLRAPSAAARWITLASKSVAAARAAAWMAGSSSTPARASRWHTASASQRASRGLSGTGEGSSARMLTRRRGASRSQSWPADGAAGRSGKTRLITT